MAVGLPNVLIWMYYFWKKDCKSGHTIKDKTYYARQIFEKFVFRANQPFLRVDQSAFLNVSIFDRNYIEALFGGMEFPDGSFLIDQVEEIIEFQKIFLEVVSEIRKTQVFTFPVLTYSLLKRGDITEDEKQEMIKTKNYDVFVDKEFSRWCSDHNVLWNDSNFFISDDVGTLSNCCRLLSSTKNLKAFINSIGGTALSIGSNQVNTTNLMHIAYESGFNEDKYLKILRERTELSCKVLEVIRHIIQRNIEKGLLPNYQDGAIEMDKTYSTLGILGLFETIESFGYTKTDEFGNVFYTDRGIEFASKIFEVINDVKDNYTDEFSFNIESVPKMCGHKVA